MGSPLGRADPAYEAHSQPIVTWAMATWEKWMPPNLMKDMVVSASRDLALAKRIWAGVKGPASALIASAARIGWRVLNSTMMITDEDKLLDMQLDPPKVIEQQVHEAVRRWRLKRIARRKPQIAGENGSCDVALEPVWKLLRSKRQDSD